MDKHLSVTQMRMFLRCPLQFKFRYVDGLKIPPASAITLGKSIHGALESNYRQKVQTKEDLPLEHVTDLFSNWWEKELSETVFEEGEKPGQVKDEGIKLVRVYHKQVAPKVQPISVEKPFTVPFRNVDYTLKGYIDLIDERGTIIDHKTTKRVMSAEAIAQDLQLTAYALAYRTLEGKLESGLRFDVMIRNKEPKIQQLTTTRNQGDIRRFLKLLGYVTKAINTGIFYPNPNFLCPACGYRDLCKEW